MVVRHSLELHQMGSIQLNSFRELTFIVEWQTHMYKADSPGFRDLALSKMNSKDFLKLQLRVAVFSYYRNTTLIKKENEMTFLHYLGLILFTSKSWQFLRITINPWKDPTGITFV